MNCPVSVYRCNIRANKKCEQILDARRPIDRSTKCDTNLKISATWAMIVGTCDDRIAKLEIAMSCRNIQISVTWAMVVETCGNRIAKLEIAMSRKHIQRGHTRERYLKPHILRPTQAIGSPFVGQSGEAREPPGKRESFRQPEKANRFANRANPDLRALGHQTPGRAEWGKKTRTRQNGSSCEQRSRSSLERSLREMRTRTSHGQTKGARAKRPLLGRL